ncbi:hypothetical protein Q5692_11710 [Microcoleus sp. C2C3]|uniref:hypothetical protein n=1 Tax=unclassified Microcoleus TaxID=2642155 RepID=UPI002FD5FCD6
MEISRGLITKLLDLLRPFLQDEGKRKAYLFRAFGTASDRLNLTWKQPTNTFIAELLKELLDFGEISPGQPALCEFLEVIREDVGVNVKDSIDQLVQQIREELQKAEITGNSFQTTDALIEQVEQYLSDPNPYICLNKLVIQEARTLAEIRQGELEACPWNLSNQNQPQCQQCLEYLEAKSERLVRILATIVYHDQEAKFITSIARAFRILARQPISINPNFTNESRWLRFYPLALAIYTVFIVGVQEEREQLLRTVLGIRRNQLASSLPNFSLVELLINLGHSHSIFNAALGTPYCAPVAERIKIILLPWLEELLLDADADAAFYRGEFVLGLADIEAPYYLSDVKRLSLKGLYLYYPEAPPILKAFLCDSSQWLVSLYPSLEELLGIFDTTASQLDRSGFGIMGFCSGAVAAFKGEV